MKGAKIVRRELFAVVVAFLLLVDIASFAVFVDNLPLAQAIPTLGNALSFNGISDRVSVPAIDVDVYTLELWFKPETNFALIGSNRFLIQTADTSLTVWHDVYSGSLQWSSVSIGTGTWRHLAVIIDYSNWQITPYLDGVDLGTKTTTTETKPLISFINIGCYWSNRFFKGLIDEVRIYDRALSAAEVQDHYNSGVGQYGRPETGLMGLWHFDGDADDYSENDNHGTVYGATYTEGHVPLPDVAIVDVTSAPNKIISGGTVTIDFKAKNVGVGAYEDFDVKAFYDGTLIGTQSVTGLGIDEEEDLTFYWDTTGVPLGTYTIKATASLVQGETYELNNELVDAAVWIVEPPTASFTYSPIPAIESLSTTFDAGGSTPNGGTIVQYTWDFDDGNVTSTPNEVTSHVYASHGVYNVTLTVEDSEDLEDTEWLLVEVLRHDVAVVDVTPYRDWVYEGWSVDVNVTIVNQGNFTEAVTVDLYYNITAGDKIGTMVIGLVPDEIATLTFTWDTTGVPAGYNYALTAVATIAVESDTTDNTLEGATKVKVRIMGDADDNNVVTMADIYAVALSFGTTLEDPEWDPNLDLNQNGVVNLLDLFIVAKNYGRAVE